MPRTKVLKSVAHNFGHSFTSLMNYAGDDYVMGHILRLARKTGRDTLTIDLVQGDVWPPELLAYPVGNAVASYMDWFWKLVKSLGSDRSLVRSALLQLKYDLATERRCRVSPRHKESPFCCKVLITDVRGREYVAKFNGWWYPEQLQDSAAWSRPSWKFWIQQ